MPRPSEFRSISVAAFIDRRQESEHVHAVRAPCAGKDGETGRTSGLTHGHASTDAASSMVDRRVGSRWFESGESG